MDAPWPANIVPLGMARQDLDITNARAVRDIFSRQRLCGVINAAGFTQVDKAESDVAAAYASNVEGPRILAKHCREADIPLLHVSTDFVFDGDNPEPYVETDATSPLNVYGITKRDGEVALAEVCDKYFILRVSWSYCLAGRNFVTAMLRLAQEGGDVPVVNDQFGAPTHHADIASALIGMFQQARSSAAPPWGVYHFANAGAASRFEVACHIFESLRAEGLTVGRPLPVRTADYPTPARRPLNSRLDTTKYRSAMGDHPASWQERLDRILHDYLGERRRVGS